MTGGLKVPFQICRKAFFFAPDRLVGAFNYRPLTQRQTATRAQREVGYCKNCPPISPFSRSARKISETRDTTPCLVLSVAKLYTAGFVNPASSPPLRQICISE